MGRFFHRSNSQVRWETFEKKLPNEYALFITLHNEAGNHSNSMVPEKRLSRFCIRLWKKSNETKNCQMVMMGFRRLKCQKKKDARRTKLCITTLSKVKDSKETRNVPILQETTPILLS